MPSIRRTSAGKFEASFRSKLLPKPHYATFDDETQARQYAVWLDGLLAKGVVPAELAESYQDRRHDPLLVSVIREYSKSLHLSLLSLLRLFAAYLRTMVLAWPDQSADDHGC